MTLQCPANFLHFLQSENIGSPDGDPIKDFPQNSREVKRVVIMNMGNSIALDLYRFLIQ